MTLAAIIFAAQVGYGPARFQPPTQTTRLQVCPLPTTPADCAAGRGWVDPINVSPIPGYWLRHVIYAERPGVGRTAVLLFCRDGTLCPGDE